jgi:hypothetical protein
MQPLRARSTRPLRPPLLGTPARGRVLRGLLRPHKTAACHKTRLRAWLSRQRSASMSVITKKRGKCQFVRDSLKFEKSRHLFIRSHNETFSVAAMCIDNPDCSPARIHS